MAIRKVSYCTLSVPSRAGQAVSILKALKDAGVNLQAFTGFPVGGGKSQVDLISDDMSGVKRVAKKQDWRLSKIKKGFMAQGQDHIGAVHNVLQKLSKNNINVVAVDAVSSGKKQYGMLFWVKPKDYRRAATVLNAK
jgi:hypothetical protein